MQVVLPKISVEPKIAQDMITMLIEASMSAQVLTQQLVVL